jgi:hypothetical protein
MLLLNIDVDFWEQLGTVLLYLATYSKACGLTALGVDLFHSRSEASDSMRCCRQSPLLLMLHDARNWTSKRCGIVSGLRINKRDYLKVSVRPDVIKSAELGTTDLPVSFLDHFQASPEIAASGVASRLENDCSSQTALKVEDV